MSETRSESRVVLKLTESNYREWVTRLTPILEQQGWLDIVCPEEEETDEEKEVVTVTKDTAETRLKAAKKAEEEIARKRKELDARIFLQANLSTSILLTLGSMKKADEMWEELKTSYRRTDKASVFKLRREMSSHSHTEEDKIVDLVGKMDGWRGNLLEAGEKMEEDDFVEYLLGTVTHHPAFKTMVGQIHVQRTMNLMTLASVVGLLKRAEDTWEEVIASDGPVASAAALSHAHGMGCWRCGKAGHRSYQCDGRSPDLPTWAKHYANQGSGGGGQRGGWQGHGRYNGPKAH